MGEAEGGKIELKKNLGLVDCVSLLIGLIIGTGIFISPKGVIQETGSVGSALLVWTACGVFSIFGAISYTEMGCMIPKAGGEYEYLGAAFGDLASFLFIWSFVIIVIPASFALTALTFADYALKPLYMDCDPPYHARLAFAALAIITITFVNCISTKWVTRLQNAFNIGKLVGLFAIMGFGAYALIIGRTENFEAPFEGSSTDPGTYATAFYAGVYSYSGWSFLNYVVEEIKNPNRVLPISITMGLTAVTLIYLFVNVAYFTLLSPKDMIDSNAVAFSFVEKLLGQVSWVMSFCVALSCLGFLNGSLLSASRAIFAAARKNHMPSVLALININYRTPITSIIFMSFLSILCLLFDDVLLLLKLTMLAEYVFIGGTVVGLLYLRKKSPDVLRPIRVNLFFPIVFVAVCFGIIAMTIYLTPGDSLLCFFVILCGIPIYGLFIVMDKPKALDDKINNFTIWVQKLTMSVIATKDD